MNPDFYRCEIDAINENGARSKTRVIAKAKHWRLITGCISTRLCGKEFRNYFVTKLGAEARDPAIYPEVEFLELQILYDDINLWRQSKSVLQFQPACLSWRSRDQVVEETKRRC
jgi:hypothetical protein